MANCLSNISKGISSSISNSWTSVLYSTLLLSGSGLARTDWEKLFLIWLAQHDQNHVGLGMVSIDFNNINWIPSEFKEQREFVVAIAQEAINKKSWVKLDYETDEVELTKLLRLWIDIISKATIDDIILSSDFNWYNKPNLSHLNRKCIIHNIYLNQLGLTKSDCCYLCNGN